MPKDSNARILLLSGYDAASHRRWREQLIAALPHYHWRSLALPPRFFRWRIRGNALTWLHDPLLREHWDLIIVTSMVDLASLRGFHPRLAQTPALLYMHENQFAFPSSEQQHASADPQMVNIYSAIAADRVLFNSRWNLDSFLAGIEEFLGRLPDGVPEGLGAEIRKKSSVVPVPIEDHLFRGQKRPINRACPHLLWNHRWEYDKGPDRLLVLLDRLTQRGQRFRLSLVGEQFRRHPASFEEIKERHGERIANFGFMENRSRYDELLAEADVVISTAVHDFQGLSMLEAMASGCHALAPHRLAYPEYVAAKNLYASHEDDPEAEADAAANCLESLLANSPEAKAPEEWRASRLLKDYDFAIESLLKR